MSIDIIAAISIALTTIILLVSETHVAFVTLAVASGYVLSDVLGADFSQYVRTSFDTGSLPVETIVRIFLLVLPALIVGIRFRRSQRGLVRTIAQAIPAFALAFVAFSFAYGNLPQTYKISASRDSSVFLDILPQYGSLMVIVVISVALFDVLIQHAGPKRKYRKKGKKNKDDEE